MFIKDKRKIQYQQSKNYVKCVENNPNRFIANEDRDDITLQHPFSPLFNSFVSYHDFTFTYL